MSPVLRRQSSRGSRHPCPRRGRRSRGTTNVSHVAGKTNALRAGTRLPRAVLRSASGRSQTSGDGGRTYALDFSAGRGSDLRIGLFEPWCPMRRSDPRIRSTSAEGSRATQPMHRPRRFAASCIVRISSMDTFSVCIAAGPALPLPTGHHTQPNTRRARMFQRHGTTRHIPALRSPPSHATVPSTDRRSAPPALYTMFVDNNVG
jgi:hypothetical protein